MSEPPATRESTAARTTHYPNGDTFIKRNWVDPKRKVKYENALLKAQPKNRDEAKKNSNPAQAVKKEMSKVQKVQKEQLEDWEEVSEDDVEWEKVTKEDANDRKEWYGPSGAKMASYDGGLE